MAYNLGSINKPGNDRVLDLHWGEATNGNKVSQVARQVMLHEPTERTMLVQIHIRPRDDKTCKHWKFEYLEEDTTHFMSEHPGADLKLAESQGEIPSKNREISQLRGELSELHTLLYHRDETIRQLEQDVKSKDEALGHAYKMNEEGAYLRKRNSLLEFKLLDQETETGRLQAKMDRVEYLMSQMMGGSDGSASTSASTGAMN